MSSEIGERRVVKSGGTGGAGTEPENLQCPRCESTNTKFCYYNNYNLSQPRYFCKACRRYWTRGGSLRNIPVGGGSRRNSKRSRSHSSAASEAQPPNPPLPTAVLPSSADGVNMTSYRSPVLEMPVSSATPAPAVVSTETLPGGGFLCLGGYGLGSGLDELAFGSGKAEWPAMGGAGAGGVGSTEGSSSGCDTWQVGEVGGGLTDGGDCYGWPELAISTPGTAGLE